MNTIRPAAVAGLFYPDDPDTLRTQVVHYVKEGAQCQPAPVDAQALIAPHAGYPYSGPIAGSAYAQWRPVADRIRRVVLIGPAHRVPLRGIAGSSATHFATPLGKLPVDQAALARWADERRIVIDDSAHAEEHGLEVHCPFLQYLCPEAAIIPLVAGYADPADVAALLTDVMETAGTRIVISSDLSHFYDYATACQRDERTVRAITAGDWKALDADAACGYIPVQGLLQWAANRQARCVALDVRNSGDTAGSHDRVVGYGAFACGPFLD